MARPLDVFLTFLRLGCTSFGGPVAHLAYFRDEFVNRRRWLDDETYAQCVALTQLLPGPGSSQTGMLVGWLAAGPLGAFAAWVGFTLPSAALMAALAVAGTSTAHASGVLHGLLLVATAVVASAILTMRASLAPDALRIAIAAGVCAIALLVRSPVTSPLAIGLAGAVGAILLYGRVATARPTLDLHLSRRAGIVALAMFAAGLTLLGIAASVTHAPEAVLADLMARVGSLVFGGGHIVLPLLQAQAAASGIVDGQSILAGYAAAQAMPGPLFTIASFVGAKAFGGSLGIAGSAIATIAIFAPSFALLAGVAPFYRQLAGNERFRAALAGANAGVIGLLASAFVTPIWASTVKTPLDVAVAGAAFLALHVFNVASWIVVLAGALLGLIALHG